MGAADIAVETNVEAKVAGTTDGYTVHELNVVMGLTLVLGFLFMMLVEHCGGGHAHSSAPLKMTSACMCVYVCMRTCVRVRACVRACV